MAVWSIRAPCSSSTTSRPSGRIVGQYLVRDGFRVVTTGDGREVSGLVERESPQLVVLDVMLPGIGGLELCRVIRSRWSIPVILLTARSEESDRIVGLELGADDYVTKPFRRESSWLGVRAVLRRGGGEEMADGSVRRLEIDVPAREVHLRGGEVRLAAREFDLLAFLARHPGGSSRASRSCRAYGATRPPSTPARSRCTSAACARRSKTTHALRGASRRSGTSATASSPDDPLRAHARALLPGRRHPWVASPCVSCPRSGCGWRGLALLASGLPLVAVVASGLIMFDTRHDALVTLIAAAASASALVGALLVSRSISLPLRALRHTAQRLADGELEARAPIGGPSELRDVASVVNEMSTALEGLLRAQRELVAAASHDLRTPLTNLRVAAEALEDGVGDPALHLASLQAQVQRMTLLVDDLLDLSRFDAGVVPLDVTEIDLEPLLDDCLALYAADARAANVGSSANARPDCGAASTRFSSVACSRISSATRSATRRPAAAS